MKIKNLLLLSAFSGLLIFSACSSEDVLDDLTADDSSASITIDGVSFTKAEGDAISFFDVEINGEGSFQISGDLANGEDTVTLSIDLPSLQVATYTKENDNEDITLSIRFVEGFNSFSNDPFTFNEIDESLIDFELEITSSNEESVSGEFNGTLMDSDGEVIEVDGEFTAVEFNPFSFL